MGMVFGYRGVYGSIWKANKGSDVSKGMSWRRRRKATAVEPRVKEMGERRKQRLPLCPFPKWCHATLSVQVFNCQPLCYKFETNPFVTDFTYSEQYPIYLSILMYRNLT